MLLSIIIPAYNAEKYLEACLDSCLRLKAQCDSQTAASEVEIIVVDDGSTDSTPALLLRYASQHPCIRMAFQANQGQSVARNLALSLAKGDYIYMVDADDEVIDAQPFPWEVMRSGRHDIIGLQVLYQTEAGQRRPWSHQMEHWPFGITYPSGASFVQKHNIEGLVYGYLFRRRLFVEHPELHFTPGIYHQDEELIFKIFTLAVPVIYLQGYTYLYYERSGSSINTRTEARKRKLMDDDVVILRNLTQWSHDHKLEAVMHYKLSYLAMDVLRVLIRKQYDADYSRAILKELSVLGLYPLPYLPEPKYLVMKLLTQSPALVKWWIEHPKLSQKIGF